MCGRFVITSPPGVLRQMFRYPEQPNFPPRYNVAPTQPVPVVMMDQGARRFQLMRWGLLPPWVKDPRDFALLINARSETVLDKPAFKNAIRRRRCLIPADGYYEWQNAARGKRPFFVHPRNGGPIGFAALAETWIGPNGEELDTVAIVTAPASEDLAVLHPRVPVVIPPQDLARWLDFRLYEPREVMPLLTGPRPGEFAWHEVSTRVNHVANDDVDLMRPLSAEQRAAEEAAERPVRKRATRTADDGQGSLF